MKRNFSAFAALAIVTMPIAGCAPHLKKLDNATRGPYRYANPHGVSLPEQPVPSVDDMIPRPAAPVLPYAVPDPGPPAPPTPLPAPTPSAPEASPVPSPSPTTPKARGNEGAMLTPDARSGAADHA